MQTQPPQLNFRPLHSGLGFHPFSDGLPYAPQTPKAPPLPRPILPPRQVVMAPAKAPAATPAAMPAQAPAPTPAPVQTPGWSYLPLRMTAFGIDVIFHLSAAALLLMGGVVAMGYEPLVIFEGGVFSAALLTISVLGWAMMVGQEVALGSTPGKRIVGLKLQGSPAALFLRAFFFLISLMFMGAGLLWALFNRERRCWHDLASDVQPR